MARIINSDADTRISQSSYMPIKTILLGMFLGLLHWYIAASLVNYTTRPSVAGDISTIIVATIGIVIMLQLRASRPLIVAVASAITLWGLYDWTNGLDWAEIVGWNAVLYSLTYLLYAWIARYANTTLALFITIAIVIVSRIVAAV